MINGGLESPDESLLDSAALGNSSAEFFSGILQQVYNTPGIFTGDKSTLNREPPLDNIGIACRRLMPKEQNPFPNSA